MLLKISLSNKCCSFKLSIHQKKNPEQIYFFAVSTEILSSTTVFNIDDIKKHFFFCHQHFFFHTTQHSIQNITEQNNRHILNISKSSQKGGGEGRTTKTQKSLLHTITYIKQKTLPSINGWRPGPTDSRRCTFTRHYLQEARNISWSAYWNYFWRPVTLKTGVMATEN